MNSNYTIRLFCIWVCFFCLSDVQSQSLEWAIGIGGTNQTDGNSVAVDGAGNVIIGGDFSGTVDFDPGPGVDSLANLSSVDDFVAKYDSLGNFLWVTRFNNFGPYGYNKVKCVKTDSSGNIYAAGYLTYGKAFVAKLDSNGYLEWQRNFVYNTGSTNIYNSCNSIDIDDSGNVYATGFFYGTTTFSYSPLVQLTAVGSLDAYIAKLNSNGILQWVKQVGDSQDELANSIAVDKAGNIYTTGRFRETVDFNPDPLDTFFLSAYGTGVWDDDIYFLKLNNSGNFIWAKSFYGAHPFWSQPNLVLNDSADIFIAGSFRGTADFDPGPNTFYLNPPGTNQTAFICKLDSAGNFNFAKMIYLAKGLSIDLDHAGNICTSGSFGGIPDFDPGPLVYSTASPGNGYILRLDQNGNFLSVTTGYMDITGLYTKKSYYIYSVGTFVGNVDFDPSPGSYILNSTAPYAFLWKLNFCSSPVQYLTLTGCDSITFSGQTFDSSGTYVMSYLNSIGCDSIIQLQVSINQNATTIQNVTACDDYFFDGVLINSSGIFYDTLTTASGCDSTIQLHLTINQSVTSTQNVATCDEYLFDGVLITSSGFYYDTLTASNGCDSIIQLQLTINQSATIIQNVTACDGYFFEGIFITSSGIFYDTLTTTSGCDSAIQLNLTMNQSVTTTQNITSCDEYLFNGVLITSSGIYYDTLVANNGCDSIIQLQLTINPGVTTTQNVTACDEYLFDGVLITSSGVFYDTLTANNGCDSVIILNLTIDIIDTSVTLIGATLTANSGGMNYAWLDCNNNYQVISGANGQSFTPLINGSYAVLISDITCTDTSSCYAIPNVGIIEFPNNNFLTVYPNPFTDKINIIVNKACNSIMFELYDVAGRRIFARTLNKSETLLLPQLSSGLYIYKLKGLIESDIYGVVTKE